MTLKIPCWRMPGRRRCVFPIRGTTPQFKSLIPLVSNRGPISSRRDRARQVARGRAWRKFRAYAAPVRYDCGLPCGGAIDAVSAHKRPQDCAQGGYYGKDIAMHFTRVLMLVWVARPPARARPIPEAEETAKRLGPQPQLGASVSGTRRSFCEPG
jgi:hypothetical protein